MRNQTFNGSSHSLQTSWSGTHGAKAAISIAPQGGEALPLPVSATSSLAVTRQSAGAVMILSTDVNLGKQLHHALAAANIAIQQFFSVATVLAAAQPIGPACLLLDSEGFAQAAMAIHEQLKAKGWRLPCVVLVSKPEIRLVVQLMRAGAEDVLLKSNSLTELSTAIGQALQLSRRGQQRWGQDNELQRRLDLLTPREAEVVRLVLAGMLNKEIAERLHLALITVKVHRGSAMRKLGARSAAELARLTLATNYFRAAELTDCREMPPCKPKSLAVA